MKNCENKRKKKKYSRKVNICKLGKGMKNKNIKTTTKKKNGKSKKTRIKQGKC